MGQQKEKIMEWVLDQLAELCANIETRYGVELNAEERSKVGDAMFDAITEAILRKAGNRG